MPVTHRSKLSEQCVAVGWPIERLPLVRTAQRQWRFQDVDVADPEEVAARHLENLGESCSWCEGGTINLLIKASALDTLSRLNLFDDRVDAIRRYLEAQFTIFAANINEVLVAVSNAKYAEVERNLREILADPFIQDAYPRVKLSFAAALFQALGRDKLLEIAGRFVLKPYDYRSGWPDLTVIGQHGVRFVEVKTTDRLHESQIRFATEIAKPLQLSCSVLQVIPLRDDDRTEA